MDNIERSKITIDRIVEQINSVIIYSSNVKDYDFHKLNDKFFAHIDGPLLVLVHKQISVDDGVCRFEFHKLTGEPFKHDKTLLNIGWNFPSEFTTTDMQIIKTNHISTRTNEEVLVFYNNQEFKFHVEILDLGISKYVTEVKSDHINPKLRKSEKGKIKKMITNYYTERLNS